MTNPLVRLEDEQALIGTLIVNPRAYAQISGVTRPEHFTDPILGELYTAIEEQARGGYPCSLPALEFHFKERWNEKLPGGKTTLGRYASDLVMVAKPFDFVGMAHELKHLWAHREISAACSLGEISEGMTPKAALDEAFTRIESVRASLAESDPTLATAGRACEQAIARARTILAGNTDRQAVTTGLIDLDREIIGYRPGTVVTVAGRPGMGKTAFATSSALRVAASGAGVGFFSLELMQDDIAARMLSDWAWTSGSPVTFSDVMRAESLDERKLRMLDAAHAEIDQLPLQIDSKSSMTIGELEARIRIMKRQFSAKGIRLGVVFIDFLKHLKVSDRYKGNRTLEIGEIMAGLRYIAKDQDICVVLLAQLNRSVESRDDKRPDLSDLRDSGEIEQDSDAVIFLYREAYYLEKSKAIMEGEIEACERLRDIRNELQLIIAKNRGGRCTTVRVFCDIASSAIRDASRFDSWGGRAVG